MPHFAIDNFGQWSLAHHCDWVLLKVMPQLPRSKEYSISYLLVVRVTLLELRQDLAYIVNWSLNSVHTRLVAAMYSNMGSLGSGAGRMGAEERISLSCFNAAS